MWGSSHHSPVVCGVSVCISDLGDVVDGRLHAPQLRGLDVQQLQDIVG